MCPDSVVDGCLRNQFRKKKKEIEWNWKINVARFLSAVIMILTDVDGRGAAFI